MILIIDNYDSFTYNLVQYVEAINSKVKVYRNDKISLANISRLNPAYIIISPGPGRPQEAGISCSVVKKFYKKIPILGVCLGHQCIGYAFGAKIVQARKIMHGKTSLIYHSKKGLYRRVKNPFTATRYHSLIIKKDTLPADFEIDAWTKNGVIMGIKHKNYPLFGVQFHPESILTSEGKKIIANFLAL